MRRSEDYQLMGDVLSKSRPFDIKPIVTPSSLDKWGGKLNKASLENKVPPAVLMRTFKARDIIQVLSQPKDYRRDILNVTPKSQVSVRKLNDAYVWANVLNCVNASGDMVAEICPGNSVVMDLALSFAQFRGTFIKADYKEWPNGASPDFKKSYEKKALKIDVIDDVEKIPISDVIVMDHAFDDLFIGLWVKKQGVDYFSHFNLEYGADNLTDLNNQAWQNALSQPGEFIAILRDFVRHLGNRVKLGGKVIFRNYPSNFETRNRLISRINFTYSLTDDLVEEMIGVGFRQLPVDLDEIDGAEGSKFKNSFYVLENERDSPLGKSGEFSTQL